MTIEHVSGKLLRPFAVLTGNIDRDIKETPKSLALAIFLIVGIAILFSLAVYHFMLGNGTRAVLLLLVGGVQLASLLALRNVRPQISIFRLNVILLGGYFLFLIVVGGAHGSRIFWALIFPMFTFFLLGKKEGVCWTLIHFLLALILITDPGAVFGTYPYETAIKFRFFMVYGIIATMGFVVEATQDLYYAGMENNQRQLRSEINERKQVEEALRSSERRLADIINFLPDATFVIDLDGKVIAWNHAIEELTGIKAERMLNRAEYEYSIPFYGVRRPTMIDLALHWDEAAAEEYEYVKRIDSTLVSETRNPPFRKKPSLFWNSARPLFNAGGDMIGAIEVIRDITERMEAEEELARHREHLEELVEERTRELQAAQEELLKNERLAVLGQLTATVSHELRNPLGVIRSSLYYLQQRYEGQNDKIKKHMNRIEDQVEICDIIVGDLLDFTRGRRSQTVEGAINPWLENLLGELPETPGVNIEKVLAEKLPKVFFDSEKMRRVIVNLLNNAIQAVSEPKRAVIDNVYRPTVTIISNKTDDSVQIMVKDNGIGMDPKTLDRAFEPLFTTKARGSGLGLAVVRKIIDEHGGTVSVKSEVNKGTSVSIKLPTNRAKVSE